MKKAEPIPKHWWRATVGAKRWLKRDPEDVPGRFTRDWYW